MRNLMILKPGIVTGLFLIILTGMGLKPGAGLAAKESAWLRLTLDRRNWDLSGSNLRAAVEKRAGGYRVTLFGREDRREEFYLQANINNIEGRLLLSTDYHQLALRLRRGQARYTALPPVRLTRPDPAKNQALKRGPRNQDWRSWRRDKRVRQGRGLVAHKKLAGTGLRVVLTPVWKNKRLIAWRGSISGTVLKSTAGRDGRAIISNGQFYIPMAADAPQIIQE